MLNKAKIPEIPPLLENDVFVLDFASKAEIFNDYFILQCTTLDTGSDVPHDLPTNCSKLTEFSISDEKILTISAISIQKKHMVGTKFQFDDKNV